MEYRRRLEELKHIKKNGYKVFSTFSCGGGSSMGYKYAGYDVIGICDIDKQMIATYTNNFKPKRAYQMGVQEFKTSVNIPPDLFNLDILDGSPPCSTFSVSGSREKVWGKNKKFREGQQEQVLSDLFFDYIDLVNKLKPKVFVAENVKGMLKGNAKGYVKLIAKQIQSIGYTLQIFLINGASMGLPQRRERVFFIGYRNDLGPLPKLKLEFNEKPIPFGEFEEGFVEDFKSIMPSRLKYRPKVRPGDSFETVHPKGKGHQFNSVKLSKDLVAPTIASGSLLFHPDQPRKLTTKELCYIGSWPLDYNFNGVSPQYIIGMSVPPLMMYRISKEIETQRLSLISKKL